MSYEWWLCQWCQCGNTARLEICPKSLLFTLAQVIRDAQMWSSVHTSTETSLPTTQNSTRNLYSLKTVHDLEIMLTSFVHNFFLKKNLWVCAHASVHACVCVCVQRRVHVCVCRPIQARREHLSLRPTVTVVVREPMLGPVERTAGSLLCSLLLVKYTPRNWS